MKPIEGMKTEPYGLPLMDAAWLGCLLWAGSSEEIVAAFEADTKHSLRSVLKARGINALIDESTGRTRETLIAFADWVTTNYWGIEGDDNGATP